MQMLEGGLFPADINGCLRLPEKTYLHVCCLLSERLAKTSLNFRRMFVAPAVVIVSHQHYKTANLHLQIRMAGIECGTLRSEHGG